MKIICIGRNYAAHAKEMNTPVPTEPVFFMKPDTALHREKDFYIPEFTNHLEYETELVLKICKTGKHIEQQFAHKYYDEIGLGIDFTARDIQEKCKAAGLPWEKAKAFDHSAPIGKFFPKKKLEGGPVVFSLKINGQERQRGSSANMIFTFDQVISYISKFVTIKTGDLIFTGTPEGVGAVKKGDVLEGFIGDEPCVSLRIK